MDQQNQPSAAPAADKKQIVFSGIQPSGNITLGNYIGALRNFTGFEDAGAVGEYTVAVSLTEMSAVQPSASPSASPAASPSASPAAAG